MNAEEKKKLTESIDALSRNDADKLLRNRHARAKAFDGVDQDLVLSLLRGRVRKGE